MYCRLFVQLICLTKTTNAYTFTFQFSSYVLYSSSSTAKCFVLFLQFLDILLKTYFQGVLGICFRDLGIYCHLIVSRLAFAHMGYKLTIFANNIVIIPIFNRGLMCNIC